MKNILFNKPAYKLGKANPQLLRIEFAPAFTKVDFGYQATSQYPRGGWVRISKDTFIRVHKTGVKYTLTKADNITITPEQHEFKTTKDWLYFSLYFPSIPLANGKIDLIEKELDADDTNFNFYDIQLDAKKAIELM